MTNTLTISGVSTAAAMIYELEFRGVAYSVEHVSGEKFTFTITGV
jgi:hypothetical protein